MPLTAPERETVITFSDDWDTAHIYTAQRRVITRLKKNPAANLIEEGSFEGSPWARFEIASSLVSFRSTRVRRELTEEQRAAAADRMRRVRA
jgi:hypothetical protein